MKLLHERGRPGRPRLRRRDCLGEASAGIARRPVRTLLTALGTILGVAAFIATTGLAQTARAQVSSRFDALRATEVRVQDAAPGTDDPFPDDADHALRLLNGVNSGGVYFTVPDDGSLDTRNIAARPLERTGPIAVMAATPGAVRASLPTLSSGRLYDDWHQQRAERVAVVGRVAAQRLGLTRVGGQPAIFLGDRAYSVVGILDDVRRNPDLLLAVVIPTSTAEAQFAVAAVERHVIIDTVPGAAQLIGRQAPLALRPQDPDRLIALVPPDPKTLRNQIESDVQTLFYLLSGLALLIGTIAIMNATLLNVVERRSEIGLRRALGATRGHIVQQVTLEAALTGSLAGVLGAAVGLVVVAVAAIARRWSPVVDPTTVLAAPLIGIVTGAVAGIAPALRAARTPPAETLRA